MWLVGVVDPDLGQDIGAVAAHAAQLVADGADLVDVDLSAAAQEGEPPDVTRMARLLRRLDTERIPVAVTTTSADVVVAAVDAGARVVFDPSGGVVDQFMPRIVAAAGVSYVLGQSVVRPRALRPTTPGEFRELALLRLEAFVAQGGDRQCIILDSGIGQLVRGGQEWPIFDHLRRLEAIGYEVFVDASRTALFADFPLDSLSARESADETASGMCVLAACANAWGLQINNVSRAAALVGHDATRSRRGLDARAHRP